MDSLISIIVPVYNVETYLTKCIESLLNQTYESIEILLIDDGSTDSSGLICDEYKEKDNRIHVFHKKNGGLSDARNYGLDRIKGDYVSFVDSDDYVSPDYIRMLYKMAESENSEISCVDCESEGDLDKINWNKLDIKTISNDEALKVCFLRQGFGVSACMKLYKSELFDDVRFPINMLYEDAATIPYMIAKCNRISYSKSKLYFWYQRDNSIMHRPLKKRDLQWFSVFSDLYRYIEKEYPHILDAYVCRYVDDLFFTLINRLVYNDKYLIKCREIKKRIIVSLSKVIFNRHATFKRKVSFLLFYFVPGLYKFMFIIKSKIRV